MNTSLPPRKTWWMEGGKRKIHPLYAILSNIRCWCNYKDSVHYKEYGGRGIRYDFDDEPSAVFWKLLPRWEAVIKKHKKVHLLRRSSDDHFNYDTVVFDPRRKHDYLRRARISKTSMRTRCGRSILCLDTGRVFKNVREASSFVGISESSIYRAIRHGAVSGGYRWEYVKKR